MAIKQSAYAKGRNYAYRPQTAGAVHAQSFTYDFNVDGAVTTADILEIGVLPPFCRIVDFRILKEGTVGATGTLDVGIMTGEFGDATDATRTSGAELFDDLSIAGGTLFRATTATAMVTVPAMEKDRGIGIKFSADQAATAGNKITLVVEYVQ